MLFFQLLEDQMYRSGSETASWFPFTYFYSSGINWFDIDAIQIGVLQELVEINLGDICDETFKFLWNFVLTI